MIYTLIPKGFVNHNHNYNSIKLSYSVQSKSSEGNISANQKVISYKSSEMKRSRLLNVTTHPPKKEM